MIKDQEGIILNLHIKISLIADRQREWGKCGKESTNLPLLKCIRTLVCHALNLFLRINQLIPSIV